jgi:GTP-binding protein
MFVDRVRVWIKGGKGGDGCCSFRREKFIPLGGPDGGNGGRGGHVWLQVDPQLNNLATFKFSPHIYAKKGVNGQGRQKSGRGAPDIVLRVPPGTAVFYLPTTEDNFERSANPADKTLILDLVAPGERHLLCKGGKGGRGNLAFKTQRNTAPRQFEKGFPGEQGQYILELRSVADVGLVGFPNAGKSSLLRALSAARPKVASYPFTTLTPTVGVVETGSAQRFTVADIPGLIEGAHQGAGLGHDFLRHVERCRVLAYVLDTAGSECRSPLEDYWQLRKEVRLYDPDLAKRPSIIVANKMDLEASRANLEILRRRARLPVKAVSALLNSNIEDLIAELHDKLSSSQV